MTAHRVLRFSTRQSASGSRSSSVLVFLVLSVLLASGLIFKRAAASAPAAVQKQKPASSALRGKEAIDQLKDQGLYSSLQEAMTASRYKAEWQTQTVVAGLEGAFELKNPAHNLREYLTSSELRVASLSDEAQRAWQLGMKLIGYGYGPTLSSIATGEITAKENRVEIQKSALGGSQSAIVEWYVNTERGIEQGFDIAAAPAGKPKGESLRLTLELSGSLKARLDESKQAMTLSDCGTSLVYSGLEAVDARGRSLSAHMELEAGRVTLAVDDTGAAYPVKIDPLLTQIVKLTPSDGAGGFFGCSVAMSGDTVVIGRFLDNVGGHFNQGSAYVFAPITKFESDSIAEGALPMK